MGNFEESESFMTKLLCPVSIGMRNNKKSKPGGDSRSALLLERYFSDTKVPVSSIKESGIHFAFNLNRLQETAAQAKISSLRNIPFVLHPVYQDLRDYFKRGRAGLPGDLYRLFGEEVHEQLRNITLGLLGECKLSQCLSILFRGYRASARRVLRETTALICNTELEYQALCDHYPEALDIKTWIIPAMIDFSELDISHGKAGDKNGPILCAGRIEDLKNQIALLEVCEQLKRPVIFAGALNPHHRGYCNKFLKMVEQSSYASWVGPLERFDLISLMKKSSCVVQASWFETVGLSALEAACLGIPVVVTDRGYSKEVFGDYACYCDPGSKEAILKAVSDACSQTLDSDRRERFFETHDEKRVGKIYKELINEIKPEA
jgi:glycosyltransferase involved in cell wall biosynthesis